MAGRYLIQPLRFGPATRRDGRPLSVGVAVTDDADRHLKEKILAVLFTAPNERVNRPQFGVGLDRHVFEPLDELTLAALEFRISEGLRRDVGDEILFDGVDLVVAPETGTLDLVVRYRRREDRVARSLQVPL